MASNENNAEYRMVVVEVLQKMYEKSRAEAVDQKTDIEDGYNVHAFLMQSGVEHVYLWNEEETILDIHQNDEHTHHIFTY